MAILNKKIICSDSSWQLFLMGECPCLLLVRCNAHWNGVFATKWAGRRQTGSTINGFGNARSVIVAHYNSVINIPVKRNFHALLWVFAQPVPSVKASSTKIAGRICSSCVFGGNETIVKVTQARVNVPLPIFQLEVGGVASSHYALAAWLSRVADIIGAHGAIVFTRVLGVSVGQTLELGVDVN